MAERRSFRDIVFGSRSFRDNRSVKRATGFKLKIDLLHFWWFFDGFNQSINL